MFMFNSLNAKTYFCIDLSHSNNMKYHYTKGCYTKRTEINIIVSWRQIKSTDMNECICIWMHVNSTNCINYEWSIFLIILENHINREKNKLKQREKKKTKRCVFHVWCMIFILNARCRQIFDMWSLLWVLLLLLLLLSSYFSQFDDVHNESYCEYVFVHGIEFSLFTFCFSNSFIFFFFCSHVCVRFFFFFWHNIN